MYIFIYSLGISNIVRQVTNETMGIPGREREIGSCREERDKYRPQGHESILSTLKQI